MLVNTLKKDISIISPLIIVGAKGVIGSFFYNHLCLLNISIVRVDSQYQEDLSNHIYNFDITNPYAINKVGSIFSKASVVLFCIPEQAILASLPILKPLIPNDVLFIDTLAVKDGFLLQISDLMRGKSIEWLSMQPLFRPKITDSFANKNAVVVNSMSGEKSKIFIEWLKRCKMNVTQLDQEQHDKIFSIIQAAIHMQLLILGKILENSKIDLNLLVQLETPPFKQIRELIAHIVAGEPRNYFEIQQGKFAKNMRSSIKKELDKFESNCSSMEIFSDIFMNIRHFLRNEK